MTDPLWEAVFPIAPEPQRRGLITKRGRHASLRSHPKTAAYQERIAGMARRMAPPSPLALPLRSRIEFGMPLPASASRPEKARRRARGHAQTPDLSNLIKSLEDALNGIAYVDDSQIAETSARKVWCDGPGYIAIELHEHDPRAV